MLVPACNCKTSLYYQKCAVEVTAFTNSCTSSIICLELRGLVHHSKVNFCQCVHSTYPNSDVTTCPITYMLAHVMRIMVKLVDT